MVKVRERLAVNKERFHMERFSLKKLNEVKGKQYRVEVSKSFADLEYLDLEMDICSSWETIRGNINVSAKESRGYYELNKHTLYFGEGCSELLNQRQQVKLYWVRYPIKINGYNLSNVRLEARKRYKKNKGIPETHN
jgi:hypothetical protein